MRKTVKVSTIILTICFVIVTIGTLYSIFVLNGEKVFWPDMTRLDKVMFIAMAIGLLSSWVTSIYHLLKYDKRDGIVFWGVIMLFTMSIGAYFYYVFRVIPILISGEKQEENNRES